MPTITVKLNEYELKMLRRIARLEHRGIGTIAYNLMHITLDQVKQDERVGMFFYGHVPKLPRLAPNPVPASRCTGWTKAERDNWILTGQEPVTA